MKSQYWVVGGKFSSLNFHSLDHETKKVEGPFKTRKEAEMKWKELSEDHRRFADYRFTITEEQIK